MNWIALKQGFLKLNEDVWIAHPGLEYIFGTGAGIHRGCQLFMFVIMVDACSFLFFKAKALLKGIKTIVNSSTRRLIRRGVLFLWTR